MRPAIPLEERLWPRVDTSGICWMWTGGRSKNGYGRIHRNRSTGLQYVHRVVWELLVGPIPTGLDIDHVCRVRACCNPDHLEPVARAVNVARGAARAGAPRSSTCRNGHALTPENTARTGSRRTCRTCKNAAARRYRRRKAKS